MNINGQFANELQSSDYPIINELKMNIPIVLEIANKKDKCDIFGFTLTIILIASTV